MMHVAFKKNIKKFVLKWDLISTQAHSVSVHLCADNNKYIYINQENTSAGCCGVLCQC